MPVNAKKDIQYRCWIHGWHKIQLKYFCNRTKRLYELFCSVPDKHTSPFHFESKRINCCYVVLYILSVWSSCDRCNKPKREINQYQVQKMLKCMLRPPAVSPPSSLPFTTSSTQVYANLVCRGYNLIGACCPSCCPVRSGLVRCIPPPSHHPARSLPSNQSMTLICQLT